MYRIYARSGYFRAASDELNTLQKNKARLVYYQVQKCLKKKFKIVCNKRMKYFPDRLIIEYNTQKVAFRKRRLTSGKRGCMNRRKPALVEKVHAKLYAAQLIILDKYCEQHHKSRSEVVRALVDTLEVR